MERGGRICVFLKKIQIILTNLLQFQATQRNLCARGAYTHCGVEFHCIDVASRFEGSFYGISKQYYYGTQRLQPHVVILPLRLVDIGAHTRGRSLCNGNRKNCIREKEMQRCGAVNGKNGGGAAAARSTEVSKLRHV